MTREEAYKTLKENLCAMCAYGSPNMELCDIRSCDNRDAIKALEQEPRKDEVILTNKEYRELLSSEFDNGYAKGYREALEQEPKKGHWIIDNHKIRAFGKKNETHDYSVHCDKCNYAWDYTTDKEGSLVSNYCPNCGAKMAEQEET